MPPWMLLTSGGLPVVLSATSCAFWTRLLMISDCTGSDAKKSGESATSCLFWTRLLMICDCTGEGDGCGNGSGDGWGCDPGGGSCPVSTNTQVGSLQPPRIEGNGGRLDAEVGLLNATNGLTVLPEPPVAVPVAEELVIEPTGKLEFGTDPAGKLMKVALVPAKPPTALLVLPLALPADVDESMLPKLAPTNPPMMLRSPVPVTVEDGAVDDAWIHRDLPRRTRRDSSR